MPLFAVGGALRAAGPGVVGHAPDLSIAARSPHLQLLRALAIQEAGTGPAQSRRDPLEACDAPDPPAALRRYGTARRLRAFTRRRVSRTAAGHPARRNG